MCSERNSLRNIPHLFSIVENMTVRIVFYLVKKIKPIILEKLLTPNYETLSSKKKLCKIKFGNPFESIQKLQINNSVDKISKTK